MWNRALEVNVPHGYPGPCKAAGGAQAETSAQAQVKLHSEAPLTSRVSYHYAAMLQLQTKPATPQRV